MAPIFVVKSRASVFRLHTVLDVLRDGLGLETPERQRRACCRSVPHHLDAPQLS